MGDADERDEQAPANTETTRPEVARPVRVLVSDILAGGREAILEHNGQDYRLRVTANGKLILTK